MKKEILPLEGSQDGQRDMCDFPVGSKPAIHHLHLELLTRTGEAPGA